MKGKRRNEEAKAGTSCGALLVQSLTSEQLARLLDVVFGDPETIARHGERLKQVDADMAEAVSRALDWEETHKRRRNLWRDLASRGLPLQHPDAEAR